MNHRGCKKIIHDYILESEIQLMENKLTIIINEHLDKLYLKRWKNKVLKTLSKRISKLNHRIAFLKELKKMKGNYSNVCQFIVNDIIEEFLEKSEKILEKPVAILEKINNLYNGPQVLGEKIIIRQNNVTILMLAEIIKSSRTIK